jgi:hypothetical protein
MIIRGAGRVNYPVNGPGCDVRRDLLMILAWCRLAGSARRSSAALRRATSR